MGEQLTIAITKSGVAALEAGVSRNPGGRRLRRISADLAFAEGPDPASHPSVQVGQAAITVTRSHATAPPICFRVLTDFVEVGTTPWQVSPPDADRPSPSKSAILHFVWRGRAPPGETLYAGVASLAVGQELHLPSGGRPVVRRSRWPLHPAAVTGGAELREEVRSRLRAAVSGLLLDAADGRGSGRAALFLSGGLDSAIIAAYAREAGALLTGYTVEFDERYGLNETPFAREVARHVGLRHRIVHVGADEAADHLDLVASAPHPCAAPAAITHLALARAAGSDGHSLILSGLGADECFGGYHKPLLTLASQVRLARRKQLPLPELFSMPDAYLGTIRHFVYYGVAEFCSLAELKTIAVESGFISMFARREIGIFRELLLMKPDANPMELTAYHEYVFRLSDLLMPALTPSFLLEDLRFAFPYLSDHVYWWAASLDPGQLYNHRDGAWWAKPLLRSAADGLLPASIVWRKRQVLLAPLGHWLLHDRFRRRFIQEIGDSPFWAYGVVKAWLRHTLLEQLRSYEGVNESSEWQEWLWIFFAICAWANRERSGGPPAP